MSGFLGTHILIYAFSTDPRTTASLALIDGANRIGVPSFNKFATVARRRRRWDWPEIGSTIARLRVLCPPPLDLTLEVHDLGPRFTERYRLAVFDALIVTAALAAGCYTLWSEDMRDELVVDDRLTVRNPFA